LVKVDAPSVANDHLKMNKELTPGELAEAYLAQLDGHAPHSTGKPFSAVFLWEDLICEEPEKAWPVFLELFARRDDDETLEQIVIRIELLLSRHWDAFHERVGALAREHGRLPRFLPDGEFTKERFELREATDAEIIRDYLENYRRSEGHAQVEELIDTRPGKALPLVLEIVNRGQIYGFDSFDLLAPLEGLLTRQGETVIDRIEREAVSSVMLRRCLWRMKRHQKNTPPEYRIAECVWRRAEQAANGTTDYNSDLPEDVRPNRLSEEDEGIISSWFAFERTLWATGAVRDLTCNDPERLWTITKALMTAAPDEGALGYIGAGPLEDLLFSYGGQFIERIERRAAVDAKFRLSLSIVRRSGMSDEIARRIMNALGDHNRYPNWFS
jgi:hypothetical protein